VEGREGKGREGECPLDLNPGDATGLNQGVRIRHDLPANPSLSTPLCMFERKVPLVAHGSTNTIKSACSVG